MPHNRDRDYRRAGSDETQEMTPGRAAVTITPSGSDLAVYVKSLWINTDGTVTGIPVEQADDTAFDFVVKAGTPLPMAFRRITAAPANTRGITR